MASAGSSDNTLKYTGRELDATGLYYYRARYYDPEVGRFLTEDPKGFDAGVNFYAYVLNNPIIFNDPMGLDVYGPCNNPQECIETSSGQNNYWNDPINEGAELVTDVVTFGVVATTRVTEEVVVIVYNDVKDAVVKGVETAVLGKILADDVNLVVTGVQLVTDRVKNVGDINGIITTGVHDNSSDLVNMVKDLSTDLTYISDYIFGDNSSSNPAGGGFVLYPRKANNNFLQSVYKK